MSDTQLWAINKNGAYCLLFLNKHALTNSEIDEIFSKFGKVKNITATGNATGYRFVEYSTLEDVERASENLKDHPTVKLVKYTAKENKKKNNENTNNSSNRKENGNSRRKPQNGSLQTNKENSKKNFNVKKQGKNANNKNKKNISNSEMELQNIDNNHVSSSDINNSDCLSINSKTICSGSIPNSKMNSDIQILPNSPQSIYSSVVNKESSAAFINILKAQRLSKLTNTDTNTFSRKELCNNSLNNTFSDDHQNHIPDLFIKKNPSKVKETKKLILNTEEIIVANIPERYSSPYILHLFQDFEPLAITPVKEIPKLKIRYCHVYFKTLNDSLEVESQFDKYDLSGKKLVVLRPCTLMAEAMNDD